jgi:hypothetical protein
MFFLTGFAGAVMILSFTYWLKIWAAQEYCDQQNKFYPLVMLALILLIMLV